MDGETQPMLVVVAVVVVGEERNATQAGGGLPKEGSGIIRWGTGCRGHEIFVEQ